MLYHPTLYILHYILHFSGECLCTYHFLSNICHLSKCGAVFAISCEKYIIGSVFRKYVLKSDQMLHLVDVVTTCMFQKNVLSTNCSITSTQTAPMSYSMGLWTECTTSHQQQWTMTCKCRNIWPYDITQILFGENRHPNSIIILLYALHLPDV